MNELGIAFGKVVSSLRKKEGVSQESLAWDLETTRKYLSDIENGKRNVSLSFANRVAKVFKISLRELLEMVEEELKNYGT